MEFVRHRVFSFAQESTRYCNYSKDKFGNELTFIKPSWSYFKNTSYKDVGYFDGDVFESSLKKAESYYFKLIEKGWKPQQARQVLPNATKTELVMTGFESDWEGFFKLRCSGAAHPDAKKLADELRELMVK
nr:MAG TPA: Thymidylate synthase complementing protein [Caudoviricetes sp.]